jgi:hypothetical protein
LRKGDGSFESKHKFINLNSFSQGPFHSDFMMREFSQNTHPILMAWPISNRGSPGSRKRISRI